MKRRNLHILQMVIINNTNNFPSLIFSSELDNYQSQSIQFCLPISNTITSTNILVDYLQYFDIYMPFSLNDEVINIKSILKFPYLEFDLSKITNSKKSMTFKFEIENPFLIKRRFYNVRKFSLRGFKIRRLRGKIQNRDFLALNYIGSWKNINKRTTHFIILNPIDLKNLNDCYIEYNLIPIGGSLNFGLKNIEIENIDINYNNME